MLNNAEDLGTLHASALLAYNRSLEEDALVSRLDERFLEQRISQLQRITLFREEVYWLTVARINELAFLCAGNYADNLQFTAAGDLLENPRLILVHIKDSPRPVVKIRHSKMTEQFKDMACSKEGIVQ